jgi:hypothetical protein
MLAEERRRELGMSIGKKQKRGPSPPDDIFPILYARTCGAPCFDVGNEKNIDREPRSVPHDRRY